MPDPMNELITITRATVKRGWTEFEPKVITGLLTGSIGAAIISVLPQFGFVPSEALRNFIIVGCYFLGSYLTPSSGMMVTTTKGSGEVVTKTTGHVVTTATGSIPTQVAPTVATNWLANAVKASPANTGDQPTQILP